MCNLYTIGIYYLAVYKSQPITIEFLVNKFHYCSDFRYESNGIFVLGVGFFSFRQISTF